MAMVSRFLFIARARVGGTLHYSRGNSTQTNRRALIVNFRPAAMIKLATSEMECRTIDACLQLFGGYGYMAEYPISRYWTDARVQRIYGGTNEIMKEVIARSLVGR